MRIDLLCLVAAFSAVAFAAPAAAENPVAPPAVLFLKAGAADYATGREDEAAVLARLDAVQISRDDAASPALRFSLQDRQGAEASESPADPVIEEIEVVSQAVTPAVPPVVRRSAAARPAAAQRTRSLAPRVEPARGRKARPFSMPWVTGAFQ